MGTPCWSRLRGQQFTSYESLIRTLAEVTEDAPASEACILSELSEVFEWCRDHGVPLEELDLPGSFPKYREASAYLTDIVRSTDPDATKFEQVRAVVARIKEDRTRDETRMWARKRGGRPRLGHEKQFQRAICVQFMQDDTTERLEITGPGATIAEIYARIKDLVE